MNRSIFIVIVDFLLLSLIAFARFDSDTATAPVPAQAGMNVDKRKQDMVDVLKTSLDQERQEREKLKGDLDQAQTELRTREQQLAEREQRVRQAQTDVQRKAEEAQRLAQERAALESQVASSRASLDAIRQQMLTSSNDARTTRERLASMESDLKRRQQEIAAIQSEALTSKERVNAMELELRKRQEAFEAAQSEARINKGLLEELQKDLQQKHSESVQLQQTLAKVEQDRAATEAEKSILATRLTAVEAEKKAVAGQIATMQNEVQAQRQEKERLLTTTEKLTEGVGQLAASTRAMTNEIAATARAITNELQQAKSLTPNTLFNEFLTNRVATAVYANRAGLFGQRVERSRDSSCVLVSDGTNVCALMHVEDTPFVFMEPGWDWDRLAFTLKHGGKTANVPELRFWSVDPRVVLIPVDPAYARTLGVKIYSLAKDPSRFQEAVLVGAREQYYGECGFQLNAQHRSYVEMDRNIFKRLSGNFSPSRGDLVFSKNGEVIGVMVNSKYCAIISNFRPMYSFLAGGTGPGLQTGPVLTAFYRYVQNMPLGMR